MSPIESGGAGNGGGDGKKVAYETTGAEAKVSYAKRRTNSRGATNASPNALRSPQISNNLSTSYFHEDDEYRDYMSLDLPPSPLPGGGWSSPALATTPPIDHRSAPSRSPGRKNYGELNGGHLSWDRAKANSARVNGHPSYHSQNQGFFARHMRRISSGLPRFVHGGQDDRYAEKEKLGRGRIWGRVPLQHWTLEDWKELPRRIGMLILKKRKQFGLMVLLLLCVILFNNPTLRYWYRRHPSLGGGSKFVMLLGANQGGGVMEWKGPREWAIERDSVRNKKKYANEWGYELEIVDLATKKRYAHEWRESWEKVDIVRNAMKKYPNAEWFWWLDLNSFIMEHTVSLQSHIFNDLGQTTYRDISLYNPLNITHPPNPASADTSKYTDYLDPETASPVGDGNPNSINIIVPQDCGGFNLGSFFVRRSAWTDRLLDIWWDPVFYEQRHMEWEHKEQDALEYIFTNQPWIRSRVGFIAQRRVNAFPTGACGDDRGIPEGGCKMLSAEERESKKYECGLQGIHYQEKERDFLVNMAGCEWGRDCWGEMYNSRQLSNHLNRTRWEKFKDWVSDCFKAMRER